MEYNFSLLFGLAVQLYEATLVSDQTPYDLCAKPAGYESNTDAQNNQAIIACLQAQNPNWADELQTFITVGNSNDTADNPGETCAGCHRSPLFSGASIASVEAKGGLAGKLPLIQPNTLGPGGTNAEVGIYDLAFANIGVTHSSRDFGIGGTFGNGKPLSFSAGLKTNASPEFQDSTCIADEFAPGGPGPSEDCDDSRAAGVIPMSAGAFKVPDLRNRVFGPLFHNGHENLMGGAMGFYNAQGEINATKDPRMLTVNLNGVQANLVEFLENALKDQRVLYQKAPFDHPELCVPHGHADYDLAKTNFRLVEGVDKYGKNIDDGAVRPLVTWADMLTAGFDDPSNLLGPAENPDFANTLKKTCPDYMLPKEASYGGGGGGHGEYEGDGGGEEDGHGGDVD